MGAFGRLEASNVNTNALKADYESCKEGEDCESGSCKATARKWWRPTAYKCKPEPGFDDWKGCVDSEDCASGLCKKYKCQAKKEDYDACWKDTDCKSGSCKATARKWWKFWRNKAYKCKPEEGFDIGKGCVASEDCASGSCIKNKCEAPTSGGLDFGRQWQPVHGMDPPNRNPDERAWWQLPQYSVQDNLCVLSGMAGYDLEENSTSLYRQIATLPANCRPERRLKFLQMGSGSNLDDGFMGMARVEVFPDGELSLTAMKNSAGVWERFHPNPSLGAYIGSPNKSVQDKIKWVQVEWSGIPWVSLAGMVFPVAPAGK